MDVTARSPHPYRTLAAPVSRTPPRWKRALLRLLPESDALAQFEWYRRLRGGRWAFSANEVSCLTGWMKVDECPAEWEMIDLEAIAREPAFLAFGAIQNNAMAVEHRAGCTCEVWPDP